MMVALRRSVGLAVSVIAAVTLLGGASAAQAAEAYPDRPITFVVSTTPGASPDLVARLFAGHLSEAIKQPVVVENRGGANGQIAVASVARAPANGYTFLVTTAATLSTNPSLYPTTGQLAVTGLKAVTKLVNLDFALTARPSLKVGSMKQLVDLAKAEPGKLNAATTALGSAAYLAAELFKQSTGLNFVTVTHNGGGQAMNSVIGDQTDLLFETVALSQPFISAGKLVPIATMGRTRSTFLPDVPTMAEAGVKGVVVVGWVALVAPKDTPDSIVDLVYSKLKDVVQQDGLKTALANMRAEPVVNAPKEFDAEWRQERAMWDRVIKKAGITLE